MNVQCRRSLRVSIVTVTIMAQVKVIEVKYANPKRVMKAFTGGKAQMCSFGGFEPETKADEQFVKVAKYLHNRNEEGNVQTKYDFDGLGRVICKMTENARIADLDDVIYFVQEYDFKGETRAQITFATLSDNSTVDNWEEGSDEADEADEADEEEEVETPKKKSSKK